MDAVCENCGNRIMRNCGYTVTIHSALVDKHLCTLACLAEWAGTTNLTMQKDFANDEEVGLDDG